MSVTLEGAPGPGFVLAADYEAKRHQQFTEARKGGVEREPDELTDEEQARLKVITHVHRMYDEARRAREPFETFDIAWDLFIGNTWPKSFPTWRAKITINKIRAFITFMQAIMTDNKPRISVEPLVEGTEDAADLLRKLVDRDWDENDMQLKIATFVLYGLIWGNGFMKITFDPEANGGRGKHLATVRPPYKIFTNRTASSIEDAEFILDVDQQTMGWVRRNFSDRAKAVERVMGHTEQHEQRGRDRDYVREGSGNEQNRIIAAQSVNGNIVGPQFADTLEGFDDDEDLVDIIEAWYRDDTLEHYQRQKMVKDVPQTTPALDIDGLPIREQVGFEMVASPIDGLPFMRPTYATKMVPVMEWATRPKYPNGRLAIVAGDTVLLRDIPAPFQIDGFPFAMWKDYDVGSFWGQGEPLALKDTQIAMNRVVSQVYDILERTGNPSFKLKKGAGVNANAIKNKPGLIIPMDEMNALEPLDKPPMPPQFLELFQLLRGAMGEISGINDSVTGQLPAANTAFATVDQLQESGAAPIRLKVRNLETGITRIGKLRVQLIQQYDRGDRPIRERIEKPSVVVGEGEDAEVVEPASQVEVQFRKYSPADLQGMVEFGIVPISSLSTSPAGAWNRWMQLFDKHLVDRRWWHQKFRLEGWKTELPRMEESEKQAAAAKAQAKQKPGPKPQAGAKRGPPKPQAPQSHVPHRMQNAAVK